MKILLTGATGFVGSHLAKKLIRAGHELTVLSRRSELVSEILNLPCEAFDWKDPASEEPPSRALQNIDAVIHLAGESIAERRWSRAQKEKIRDSRVGSTRNLLAAIRKMKGAKPNRFLCASAIGFYGDRGDQTCTENSPAGEGFLAEVCREWEAEASHSLPGMLTAMVRIGIVLGQDGGMLKKVLPLFRAGLAGPLGNGKQWMSWVHVEDLAGLFVFLLDNPELEGIFNGVAPHPVTNADFTKAMGRALHRSTFFPAPRLALKLFLGELSSLMLGSTRVQPERFLAAGFHFEFPHLKAALANIVTQGETGGGQEIRREQWVPLPVTEVFPFFCNEMNLERLTPPWMNFHVLGKTTPQIKKGTLIDYKLRLRGIPLKWKSRIEEWEPNRKFVDTQVVGPYRLWHHTHEFESLAGGTLVTDCVRYELPGGRLGTLLTGWYVKRDLEKIFRYRREQVAREFG